MAGEIEVREIVVAKADGMESWLMAKVRDIFLDGRGCTTGPGFYIHYQK